MRDLLQQRINDYLSGGGLFNPEMANHEAVRDLLIDCRDELANLEPVNRSWLSKGNPANAPVRNSGAPTKPEQEHKPWCDHINIMLTSMPPQRAKCNCKIAKPEIPTKIFGPNLEEILNAAGFYRRDVTLISDGDKQEPFAWLYHGHVHEIDPSDWAEYEVTPLYKKPQRKEWVCKKCGEINDK
jgi:hypothetical protein